MIINRSSYWILLSIFFINGLCFAGDDPHLEWSVEIKSEQNFIHTIDFDPNDVSINVKVKNTGTRKWESQKELLNLSYHYIDGLSNILKYDNQRFSMTDLHPGEVVTLPVEISDVPITGDVWLQLDMVREGVSWFSLKNPHSDFPKIHVYNQKRMILDLAKDPMFAKACNLRTLDLGKVQFSYSFA
jgi:hypothetical protein